MADVVTSLGVLLGVILVVITGILVADAGIAALAERVGASVRVRTLPTGGRTAISRLIALQGPHQQIAEVIDRLTCLTCGRKPTHVDIARNSPSPACIPLVWPNTSSGRQRQGRPAFRCNRWLFLAGIPTG